MNNSTGASADAKVDSRTPHNGSPMDRLLGLNRLTNLGQSGSKTPKEIKVLLDDVAKAAMTSSKEEKPLKTNSVIIDDGTLSIDSIAIYAVESNVLFVSTILLESTAKAMPVKTERLPGGIEIEIDRYTADFNTEKLQNIVSTAVSRDAAAIGLNHSSVIFVSTIVMPDTVNPESINDVSQFYLSAVSALSANILGKKGLATTAVKAYMYADRSLKLTADVRVTPGASHLTPSKEVVYGDIDMTISASEVNSVQDDIHSGGNSLVLSNLKGYMDFLWTEPQFQNYGQQQGPVPAYEPVFIVTSLSTQGVGDRGSDNLTSMLIGLSGLPGILSNNKWEQIFNTMPSDVGTKTSIGALGYGHNPLGQQHPTPPAMIDVVMGNEYAMGNTQNTMTPRAVIQAFCTQRLSVAMDIRNGGIYEWAQSILAGATKGSPCEKTILRELDSFSDNLFTERCWNGTQPIIIEQPMQVHLGTYVNAAGHECDIRTLDMLTMLKASEGDTELMTTFINGSSPGSNTNKTIMEKRRLIQNYAAPTKLNGMATRVFININFIMAIEKMLSECGLVVGLNGFHANDQQSRRTGGLHSQFGGQMTDSNSFRQFGNVPGNGPQYQHQFNTGAFGSEY